MLSAEAYSFRQKSRLAISLSWIAGYTNIAALLVSGHFVSHMTGNTTVFSSSLGARHWREARIYGGLLGSFLVGAALSSLMTESARRRGLASKFVLPMAIEAILLAILGVWIARTAAGGVAKLTPSFAFLAALAMGLQNATITRISGAVVRTTHVTGVVTDMGLEGMQFLFWCYDKLRWQRNATRLGRAIRVSRRHPTFLRLLLLASILSSFIFGAVVGTVVLDHYVRLIMIPPVAFLLWILFMDWRHPIADVRELDLFSDAELKMHGIVMDLLPRDLGIYRISDHHAGARAPHFRAWAERIPRRWRIIILAFSPITQLTDNAVLDLLAAAGQLREQGRTLIIANSTSRQFKILSRHDGIDELGAENVVPDLEFAIARAIAVMRNEDRERIGIAR